MPNLKPLPGCNDYLLYDFIKVTTGQKEPPENWDAILNEYSELSGDATLSKVFTLSKQITYLTNRLNIIQLIINQLSLRRNEELISLLQVDLSFKVDFTDLKQGIERVIRLAKSDRVKLKLAQDRYANLQKDDKTSTEHDWTDELIELGKFQTWRIDSRVTTVGEYLAIKKAYKQYVEHSKKNQVRH